MTDLWCSFLPTTVGLLSALLGGLIGWALHRQRTQEQLDELETLQSNFARLTQAHDTLNIRCENLQQSFASLNETHKKLEDVHAELHSSLTELKAEKKAVWENRTEHNGSNGSHHFSLETTVETPQNGNYAPSTTVVEAPKVAFDYMALMTEKEALNNQIAHLESQLALVSTEYFDHKNTATVPVSDTEEQLKTLRGQYESMLDSYIKQGQRIKELTSEAHNKVIYFSNLEAEKKSGQLRISSLEAEKRTLEVHISSLEAELGASNSRYLTYKNQETERTQQVSAQSKDLQEQYETVLDKYVQQGQRIKDLTTEIHEWQGHFDNLMLKTNNQNTQVIELEETRAKLEKEVEILRGRSNELQERNTILEHELAVARQKQTELSAEKEQINRAFSSMNSAYTTKSSNWELRYNELEARHSSLTRRMQDLNANTDNLEKTISGLNAELIVYKRRANPDDLKIIEGIGPKIEELLNNAGIYTYTQLATTEATVIRAILDKAGNRFRMHDPSTWSIQADIAHKGDWVKLKEYQDYLIGGRNQEQPFAAGGK
jgi:predicted flap endonuclease-1-like 5' DNA nuclease/predicted nuclease with TOPRIM domain